jgi:arginine-tRNA-protein transferase
MSFLNEPPFKKLQFYVTTEYKCGYLPNKIAQSLIATPNHLINTKSYGELISQGFRRSGKFAYRPHCEECNACISVRVVLNQFMPTRSQKRAYKQHAHLTATILPLNFKQAHFDLYAQYQALRHPADEALVPNNDIDDVKQYQQFICQSNVESLLIEFKDAQNEIKIISIVDIVRDGISAVYTFYNASDQKASYGTYAVMWLTEWSKNLNLPYLYLGYWIQENQKMAYKVNFKPQEKLIDGEWVSFST